ncbi:MAG TPA: AI-2E family transporter [Verrucomicrobiae bacterium]
MEVEELVVVKPDSPESGEDSSTSEKDKTPTLNQFTDFLRGPRGVGRLASLGTFALLALGFLYLARVFILPIVLATILSFLFRPVVRLLARFHVPVPLGAALVLGAVLFGIGNGISGLTKPATEMIAQAPENFAKVDRKVREWLPSLIHLRTAGKVSQATKNSVQEGADPEAVGTGEKAPAPAARVTIAKTTLSDILFGTTSFLSEVIETIVLLYFLLASGDLFMQKLVKVMPSFHDKKQAVEIAHEVQENVSRFLLTITIINACLGTAVGLVLYSFGMPNPLLWGVLAGLLNFMPYFGPIIGVSLLTLAGLSTFEPVARGLIPPAIYLGMHALEANFITPTVVGKRLTLNPVVIFISFMFWMWLWGIAGAVIAVPLLMMIKILCDHFKPLAPFGEFLSG